MASVIGQTFLRLKDQIYRHGVYIDLEIPEDLFIWARPDVILQVIYDLLTTQIGEVTKTAKKPKMMIQGRGLGGMVVLNLNHNGDPYDKRLMVNVKKKGQRNGLPPEL